MERGDYVIKLCVNKRTRQFDMNDQNYLDGTSKHEPPDFNLHLALFLLEKEHLPLELLEQLEQWVKDVKMVFFKARSSGVPTKG